MGACEHSRGVAPRRLSCPRTRRAATLPCEPARVGGSGAAILSWTAVLCALAAALALLSAEDVRADFIYVDFNDTTGLLFNQNSTTTSCDDSSWVRATCPLPADCAGPSEAAD